MENFEITLEYRPLTARQRQLTKYIMLQKMVAQDAEFLRIKLLKILEEKFDFSNLTSKENLIIRFSRYGEHSIDYSSIRDRKIRLQFRRIIESSYPIVIPLVLTK